MTILSPANLQRTLFFFSNFAAGMWNPCMLLGILLKISCRWKFQIWAEKLIRNLQSQIFSIIFNLRWKLWTSYHLNNLFQPIKHFMWILMEEKMTNYHWKKEIWKDIIPFYSLLMWAEWTSYTKKCSLPKMTFLNQLLSS